MNDNAEKCRVITKFERKVPPGSKFVYSHAQLRFRVFLYQCVLINQIMLKKYEKKTLRRNGMPAAWVIHNFLKYSILPTLIFLWGDLCLALGRIKGSNSSRIVKMWSPYWFPNNCYQFASCNYKVPTYLVSSLVNIPFRTRYTLHTTRRR